MKTISKLFALALALILVVSVFAACGEKQEDTKATEAGTTEATEATEDTQNTDVIAGAFTPVDSPIVTDEVKALVEKATAELTGAEYEPVAYVATQIVAGKNHLILCKITPVVPDSIGHYSLVTIYEDLNGNASILEILDSEKKVLSKAEDGSTLAGGYYECETPEVTDKMKTALDTACAELDGAEYEPVAVLGEQVVAGMNYLLLCRITPVVQNPEPHYSIVTVYADLDGNAEITETLDFAAAQ